MDMQHSKNVYSLNVNKDNNDLYGNYTTPTPSCVSGVEQPQTQRPQHFLPPYAMPVPMTNNMSQQLMYNTQNQPMYNIMYGPQPIYRNQNTSSFPQTIDAVPWVPDTCVNDTDVSKNKYVKYENKSSKENVTNCCPPRMENIPCSPLPDVYKSVNKNFYYNKNGIMDSQWFYGTNYDSQKYKELPSCSQVAPYNPGTISNIDECCTPRDKNIKSVKYCSIQKYPETDSKLYMYQNKYDNQEMFSSNQYPKISKDYPSCSQLTSTCNLYVGNSSYLEVDKKMLIDNCDVTNPCDIILPPGNNQGYYSHPECPPVLEHFDVEKIDDKNNEESNEEGGGESDIVVEDSDEEVTDESEDIIEKEEIKSCLVCNKANSENMYVITSTNLFTTYSKTLVSNKLFDLLGSNKNNSNNLCSPCMNLINTLDNLEMQLNNIKQDIIEKYKSTLETLKLFVDTKISGTQNNCENKLRPDAKRYRNIKFKSKDVCGIHSFKCCICEKIFSLKKFYKYHMSKHKIKTKYLCEHCGCNFVKHSNLKIHLRKHAQNNFKTRCTQCNKEFSHMSSFKKHNCTNSIELKTFVCHICGKLFKTKTNLKDHENFCSGEKPFHCYECDKQFTTATKLKNHILVKHDQKFNETCKTCGKGFVKRSDYKAHLLTHSPEKKFKCQVCNKTYKTLSNLNYHAKSHNEKLPFNCDICQKGFLRKEHLEAHMNMHNGLKPFNCPICDKKFGSQKNLDAHVRVHKGTNKKQTCTICGKQISHGLEDHMRTHSNIKQLECNFCPNKFLTKGALAKHKKRKHDNFDLDIL